MRLNTVVGLTLNLAGFFLCNGTARAADYQRHHYLNADNHGRQPADRRREMHAQWRAMHRFWHIRIDARFERLPHHRARRRADDLCGRPHNFHAPG